MKPRISFFKNSFKSRFDSRFIIYAKNRADWHRNHWFWCIVRRVTAVLLEKKDFGPNVRYCVLGHHGGPCADEVDLEVYSSLLWYCHRIYSLFTLQKPQVYLRPTQVDLAVYHLFLTRTCFFKLFLYAQRLTIFLGEKEGWEMGYMVETCVYVRFMD